MKESIENILSTGNPDKLDFYWNEYLKELNKINFKSELLEGKMKILNALNDSFTRHRANCIAENEDAYDLKDLVFSFANMSNYINNLN